MKLFRWRSRYFWMLPNRQYSTMTSSSLLLRLVVQAPSRLRMLRCLPRWIMILSSAISALM